MHPMIHGSFALLFLFAANTFAQPTTLNLGFNGTAEGTDTTPMIAIIKQAARQMNLSIHLSDSSSERSLKLANLGLIDGEIARHTLIEPMYLALVRVDAPIDSLDYWVWIKASELCQTNLEHLARLKPIGVRGMKFNDVLVYPQSQVGYEIVNHPEQIIEMLDRSRAGYTVHSAAFIHTLEQDSGIQLKRCFDKPLFSLPLYLYLHESHQDMVANFAATIRRITDKNIVSETIEPISGK